MTKAEVVKKVIDAYEAIGDLQMKIKSVLDDIETISMILEDIPDDPSDISSDKVN